MKETELWARMDTHLGRGYSRVWSAEHSLAELDSRTVDQALAAGLSDQAELEVLAAGWRWWGDQSDAWFAVLHGELLARVP